MQALPVEMLFAGQRVWNRLQASPRPEITEKTENFRVTKLEDPTIQPYLNIPGHMYSVTSFSFFCASIGFVLGEG